MKMNKAQFKSLVKECVRECIKEIMQEQINPTPIQEAFSRQLINPMDNAQMINRDAMLRSNVVQSQLQRQAQRHSPSDILGPPAKADTGYLNPSDRLRAAGPPARRFDPSLDAPVGGGHQPRVAPAPIGKIVEDVGHGVTNVPSPEVLREVFDDTMRTTLPMQHAAEKYGPVEDRFAAQVATSNPDDLFVGSQNWATLAFGK